MSYENHAGSSDHAQPNPEAVLSSIEREELRLLDEQREEATILEVCGITEKAREVLRQRYAKFIEHMSYSASDIAMDMPGEPVLDDPSVRVAVVLLRERYGDNTVIEKPAIRFSRLKETTPGHTMISHDYVDVSNGAVAGTNDSLVPNYDFIPGEVAIVEGMLRKRRYDYESGIFPHLHPNLADISDPSSAMMVAKPPQI